VGPIYGLSLMPRNFDEDVDVVSHKGSLLDRGISVLVNYVAVPIIAAYALILHAYAIKIVIDGELPKGQIATMVSVFAVGGTAAWLVAWPWREQGTRLLRLFMRYWFFLLIVPAILLTIAIWRRLADYGVTPDRYGIVQVAIWVAALVIYLAIRRNRADMRVMLGAAAVLLIAGSVGPFGANGLTIESQVKRLETLLIAKGILKDGKVEKKGMLPGEDSSAGMSILYALKDVDGLDRLRPWFKDETNAFWAGEPWFISQQLGEKLGFSPSSAPPDAVSFYSNAPQFLELQSGATFMGPFNAQAFYGGGDPAEPTVAWITDNRLKVRINGTIEIDAGQAWLLEEVKKKTPENPATVAAIAVEVKPGLTLVVDQIYGNLNANPPLSSLRFWIIRQRRP
jgi:hypothetical protein